MANAPPPNAALRIAWMLFQDVNTRFNLLIDECAHLQNTIFGYLPASLTEEILARASTESARGKRGERAWYKRVRRKSGYYRLSAPEASLVHLYTTLGALAQGLESGQTHVRDRFERYVKSIRLNISGEELYWFLCARGSFVEDVFKVYLEQIQHSHEMLVQIIENRPGSTPSPILMRRWSSGAYGKFLTSYSRQVNWEVQDYLWRKSYADMLNNSGESGNPIFEEWKSYHYLTHAWAHEPTSLARTHTINYKAGKKLKLHSISSSYFYLEQPVLLPLLYHECAHEYLREENFSDVYGSEKAGTYSPIKHNILFERKQEIAETLRRTFTFEGFSTDFWTLFINEVWADLISIRLCGLGYLTALSLQIIGASGVSAYSRYMPTLDTNIPLDEICSDDRQIREVHYPNSELHYFWEARLTLAIRALQEFGSSEDEPNSLIASLTNLINDWNASGAVVNDARNTSHEHKVMWDYRVKLNQWVVKVCGNALSDLYKEFANTVSNIKPAPTPFDLNPEIEQFVKDSVCVYENSLLSDQTPNNDHVYKKLLCRDPASNKDIGPLKRMEDVTALVRWYLSKIIVDKLLKVELSGLDKFTEQYASYIRNDGSTAFRLCYEWMEIRTGVCMASVDWLESESGKNFFKANAEQDFDELLTEHDSPLGRDTYKKIAIALKKDVRNYFHKIKVYGPYDSQSERENLVALFSKKGRVEQSFLSKITNFNPLNIQKVLNDILSNGIKLIEDQRDADNVSPQIPAGTLTFGLIQKPGENLTDADDEAPYLQSLLDAQAYFKQSNEALKRATNKWENANFKFQFFPLIGDYSFISYLHNNTPVERDCHPFHEGQFLTKPRFVVCVLGGISDNQSADLSAKEKAKPPHPSFGRLAQITFRYRWEWIDLAQKLKKQEYKKNHPTLFLSSAWEDAILLIWFDNEEEWINISRDLGLSMECNGLDIQSNVIVDPSQLNQKTLERSDPVKSPDYSAVSFSEILETCLKNKVAYVGRRTGRYDFTVVWRKPGGHTYSIEEFWQLLVTELPKEFWQRIEHINTYVEERVIPVASDEYGTKGQHTSFEIVSQLVLKHSFSPKKN